MIGGSAPDGSARNAVPDLVCEKAIMPPNATSTAGIATSARRRSTGTGQRRSTGTARHTTASDASSATLLANSVVVGAIINDASSPSDTA